MIVETADLFYLISGDDKDIDFETVDTVFINSWRHGAIYRLVVKHKETGSLWGIDYREGTDDDYYNSLQSHLEWELKPVVAKEVVKMEYSYGSN